MISNTVSEMQARRVIERELAIGTVEHGKWYSRDQESLNGAAGRLCVGQAHNGDMFVSVVGEPGPTTTLRFKSNATGRNPRTAKALLLLAEAMRLDRVEFPAPAPSINQTAGV